MQEIEKQTIDKCIASLKKMQSYKRDSAESYKGQDREWWNYHCAVMTGIAEAIDDLELKSKYGFK